MPYAGFDRADCPPLEMMARLKDETNLAWCGFYLPAPSQRGATWKGKRAPLAAMGWGLAPIFVGQQVSGPGARTTTMVQGVIDGAHASAAVADEGFAPGSWVYLDLENGPPLSSPQRDYVGAWVDAVNAGRYRAGVYCSYLMAHEIAQLRRSVRLWVFHLRVKAIVPHAVSGVVFDAPDPALSGYPVATVWQHDDEARLTQFGALACDLDSSSVSDPGAPDFVAAPKPVPAAPPPDVPGPPEPPPDAPSRVGWLMLGAFLIVAVVVIAGLWAYFR